MIKAAIGLGANIGDAIANIEEAIVRLSRLGKLAARSSLYRTKPWGYEDQPDFINAAAIIEVDCPPQELLAKTQAIEKELGRVETFTWGPRVIDIDILTYCDLNVDEPNLVIPHPRMLERAFVLVPLAEIDRSYEEKIRALPADLLTGVKKICL